MRDFPVKLAVLSACSLFAGVASAQDPCGGFKWDADRERTVFATAAHPLAAVSKAESAQPLTVGTLYELSLVPQSSLSAKEPIGAKSRFEGAFGGFVRLHAPAAGRYRIALGDSGWIDALSGEATLHSSDFSGAQGCHAPHKIVVFVLPAGEILLQLSGIAQPHLRLSVTADTSAP
ncbi:MAG: hypothetical protein JSS29_15640 [Proteobacteria bacterium]|nr:hypothetical protein [Pseudomonadota bacterium]